MIGTTIYRVYYSPATIPEMTRYDETVNMGVPRELRIR